MIESFHSKFLTVMNIILLSPEFQKLKKELSDPNIFSILSLGHYEIRHSNFLAWLINPQETHRLKNDDCLKLIKILFPNFKGDYENPLVYREKDNIDLLIECDEDILVLENKVYAKDHTNQLKGYREKVTNSKEYGSKKIHFTYLTLKGDNPTDKDEVCFWATSSYKDIVDVLKEILKNDNLPTKTNIYIKDYIKNIELRILKSHSINKLAKKITSDYKNEIYDLLASESFDDAPLDISTALEFIRSNSSFVKGNGFFREDSHFRDAFIKALERSSYIPFNVSKKQSTYLSFYPKEFDKINVEITKLPFQFSFRFFEKTKKLFLYGTILPEKGSNSNFRTKIINERDLFSNLLKKNFVTKPGKKHVGVYSKSVQFNPLDYDEFTSATNIKSLIDVHFKKDIRLITNNLINIINSI